MLQFFYNKTNKTYLIFALIGINIFILPIVLYGIKDLEEYQLGYFTLKTYINFPLSFLYEYVDFYGPGVKLPIGHFPILHPSNIFLFNTKLHFFFYYFITLTVQFIFFKKIFKLIFKKNHYIIFFIIFSISYFNYSYSDDWSGAHFNFTIFFPCFYYLLKFSQKKNDLSFYKFIFFMSFGFLNGHLGHLSMQYIFFLFFVVFNNHFFFLKEKRFYIGSVIFLVICLPTIYHLFNEFFFFASDLPSTTQPNYTIEQFLLSLFSPFINNDWPYNRGPYFGIFVLIAMVLSLKNILNHNLSKKIYFLDRIFLLFVFFSLTSFSKYFYIISGIWNFRDIYNILSIIVIFHFLKTRVNYLISVTTIQILFVFMSIYFNINYIDKSKINYFHKSNIKSDIFEKKNNTSIVNAYKTFLSPKINQKIRNGFKKNGTFAITDLIFDNYAPFNGWFKNYSVDDFQNPSTKMHGRIDGNYKDLNNINYLKNFLIEEIIFFESEIPKINIEKFLITKKIKWNNDVIIFAKIKEKGFPTLIKTNFNYSNCNKNEKKIKCNIRNNTITKDIIIKKINLNIFQFHNNSNNDVNLIFPFSDIQNWKSKTSTLERELNLKRIGILKLKKNEILTFKYVDKLRIFLKIVSLLTLLLLIFYIIRKYEKI